jgi:TPR repeat protein
VPPPHSEATQLLLQIYGRTGVRLLRRSDARNGRDCMRLAVIALLKGWPDEARRWLHCAGDAGHGDAITLLYDPHWKREAAELAYHYGCEYQRADPRQLSVAIFFYRLAGDHGHPEAAYRLALAHQRKEEDWAAAMWFGRAATNGHPTAATEFHDASEHLIQAPWDADGILPIEVSNATAPLESLWPRDDSPPAFT